MNVTDLRTKLRRSPVMQTATGQDSNERRKADRRIIPSDSNRGDASVLRIWLTPGERALIEDLYLLEDK